jgi:hypothetical protein
MTGGPRSAMSPVEIRRAMELLASGTSISAVSRAAGRSRKVISRIAREGATMVEARERVRGYVSRQLCSSRHFAAQGRLTELGDSKLPPANPRLPRSAGGLLDQAPAPHGAGVADGLAGEVSQKATRGGS